MCAYDNTGKTSRARALAHYYNTPVLVIDDVVTEALYYSGTPAAVAARLLCTEAAARAADVSPATDSNTDKSAPRMLCYSRLFVNIDGGPKKKPDYYCNNMIYCAYQLS